MIRPDAPARERMLNVAAELMSRQGYAGTSVADIVAGAGVQAPALYWHFKSKQGILAAVMDRGAAEWEAGLPSWDETPGATPAERLIEALGTAGAHIRENPQFLRLLILLSFELGDDNGDVREVIRRVRTRARGWIAGLFAAGWPALRPEQVERLTIAAMAFADGFSVAEVNSDAGDLDGLRWSAELLAREAEALVR
jgi:AcrR family transcriptional regulator